MKVSIIGAGYVGLTTAVSLAYLGHQIIAVDKDKKKLELLLRGKSPIHETGIEELLKEAQGKICFTENIHEAATDAELIMVAVGTPAKPDGTADTGFVEQAAREIGQVLSANKAYTLVVKSTVPIGTSKRVEQVIKRTLIERDVNVQVFTASNPEFLREGMALRDSLYPDRIVVGAEQAAAVEAVRRLYRPILEQTFVPPSFVPRPEGYVLPPLITTDSTSAEMIKYSANAFLAVKISFINEIAGLCEKVGAHVTEVARGIGLDPRIGPRFLQAGLGWGGSCFPKDTSALLAIAEEYGYTMPIVKAARDVNFRQRYLIIEKLQRELKILRGKTIGILGLAFKPNTDDVRESPALALAGEFLQKGAMIRAYDPVAVPNARMVLNNRDMEYCNDPYTVALECDTIILATEWEEFRHLNWLKIKELMKVPIVLDARNFLNPGEIRKDGLEYLGIGR